MTTVIMCTEHVWPTLVEICKEAGVEPVTFGFEVRKYIGITTACPDVLRDWGMLISLTK
jgi:hypothetical protein